MSAMLFVGGPLHGTIHDVPDESQYFLVDPVPVREATFVRTERYEDPVRRPYVRQKFGDPRTKRMREVMVWGDLGYSHPRIDFEFRQALVTAWVNGRIG